MFLDQLLVMCDSLTVGSDTAVIASTSYIDTLAAGDDYAGCFANFLVETSIPVSGTAGATVTFALQTADSSAATAFTNLVSCTIDDAITAVAAYRYQVRIPTGTKRYIRATARMSVVSAGAVGGTYSAFITKDSDANSTMVA